MGLNDQLNQEIESLQALLLAEHYLVTVKKKLNQKAAIIASLEQNIEKEYKDVERLEQKSLATIFKNILGDQQQQLEIERQEYLDAVLSYKDATRSMELLEFEVKVLEEKVLSIPNKRERIAALIEQREKKIEKSDIRYKSKYLLLSQQIDGYFRQRSEVSDAKIAGAKSKRSALHVLEHLKKAAAALEWGHEIAVNQSKTNVDAAVEHFYKLKIELLKFEEELDDVYTHEKFNLYRNLRQFNGFVDTYTNFLINDWVIRGKISNMISMMESLFDEIIRLMSSLERKQQKIEQSIEEAEEQKRAIARGED